MTDPNTVLFKNFETETEINLQARKSIYLAFIDLLCEIKQIDKWIMPYFITSFSNGTYSLDGNPIFSAVNKNETRIIKIILLNEEANILKDTFVSNYDGKEMLVCSLLYTKENLKSILKKIKVFILK